MAKGYAVNGLRQSTQMLGGVNPSASKSDNEFLKQIANDIAALRGEYVTPLTFIRSQFTLGIGFTTPAVTSGSNPVHRIIIQVFTGKVDFYFTDSAGQILPDMHFEPTPNPCEILLPGDTVQYVLKNADTGISTCSVIMCSAGG